MKGLQITPPCKTDESSSKDAVVVVIILRDYSTLTISCVSSCAPAQDYPNYRPCPSIYSRSSTTPPVVAA